MVDRTFQVPLVARDGDTGSNARISYSIIAGDDLPFFIDKDTAAIFTNATLGK